jgi:hypothetical protein
MNFAKLQPGRYPAQSVVFEIVDTDQATADESGWPAAPAATAIGDFYEQGAFVKPAPFAVLEAGRVVDIVLGTALQAEVNGWVNGTGAHIDDTWAAGVFTTPPPPSPHAIIENGRVVNVANATAAHAAEMGWPALPAGFGIGDLYAMGTFSKAPPDPLKVQAEGAAAIQKLLDDTARAHGYDDLERCISYIGDAVAAWSAEATRAKAWRSECWSKAKQIQDDTAAGNWPTALAHQVPTVADVLAAMPPANWPA